MTNITERYNQEKESTIQYDISELLHTDLSDDLKERLMNLGNPTVGKFIALFPIQDKIKFSAIRDALNDMKDILPKNFFEDTKDEVTQRTRRGDRRKSAFPAMLREEDNRPGDQPKSRYL